MPETPNPETEETPEVTPVVDNPNEDIDIPEDFDPKRAMRTILTQRESENKLKQELAEAKAKAQQWDAAEEARLEAERSIQEKLDLREKRIAELETSIKEDRVKSDFLTKAAERGYKDPALAFIAAKEQGILGEYDPDTKSVGDHDLEALEASHPSLADQAADDGRNRTGDAGVHGTRPAKSVQAQFNKSIRDALTGRS